MSIAMSRESMSVTKAIIGINVIGITIISSISISRPLSTTTETCSRKSRGTDPGPLELMAQKTIKGIGMNSLYHCCGCLRCGLFGRLFSQSNSHKNSQQKKLHYGSFRLMRYALCQVQ